MPSRQVPLWTLKGAALMGDVIGRIRGRRFFFDSDVLEKLVTSAWYSSEKIARELGYRPTMTLDDGLPHLVAWYRHQGGNR